MAMPYVSCAHPHVPLSNAHIMVHDHTGTPAQTSSRREPRGKRAESALETERTPAGVAVHAPITPHPHLPVRPRAHRAPRPLAERSRLTTRPSRSMRQTPPRLIHRLRGLIHARLLGTAPLRSVLITTSSPAECLVHPPFRRMPRPPSPRPHRAPCDSDVAEVR